MPSLSFTSTYTVPGSPQGFTLDPSLFNTSGYVRLTWTNGGIDPAFYSWRLYRRISGTTTYVLVYETKVNQASYAFNDYQAPANTQNDYSLVQVVTSVGTQVEGTRTASPISPVGDKYWIVCGDSPTLSIRLDNTKGHTFGKEHEKAEINIIGRGRHIEKGTTWGERGTIEVEVYDTSYKTAKQSRIDIDLILESGLSTFLRDPFGNVIRVDFGDYQITRKPGMGLSEAFTSTMPYAEVF